MEGRNRSRRGRNWMSAMGILFIVTAIIIMVRNLVLFNIQHAAGLIEDGNAQFLDNFSNGSITNEKFAVAMVAAAAFCFTGDTLRKKKTTAPLTNTNGAGSTDNISTITIIIIL